MNRIVSSFWSGDILYFVDFSILYVEPFLLYHSTDWNKRYGFYIKTSLLLRRRDDAEFENVPEVILGMYYNYNRQNFSHEARIGQKGWI